MRTSRRGYVWALGALCTLVISVGTVTAALPEAPTVAGCPVTVLLGDGSITSNERAPNANYLYGRAVWLIPAAEAAANGLVNGTVPSAIGFRYSTAPGVVATGSLKIYLQNTADATNLKSTTWTTAITGMTLVSNATATLPNTTAPFDLPFSGGSAFTYTGGALYVAFDWQWSGPVGTAATVACNSTGLEGGLMGAQSSVSIPTTVAASNFRPETRLTPSVASVFNDASVDYVYSLGSLAQPLVGPQTVQAVITNRGSNALSGLPVTFALTGVETFSDTQTITGPLAGCGGRSIVTFAPFTPSAIGSDTVTVSVPVDDVATNNSKTRPLDETFNLYSYKYRGTTAFGGFGDTSPIAFLAKFSTTTEAKISAVNLEFFSAMATTYKVIVYPDSGSGTPGLVPLYIDAADRTVGAAGPVSIALPTPIAVGPGTFYAGVEQTNTVNLSLSYDAETPIRTGSFYAAFELPPATWADFAPLNDFKPNIGITLVQCATAAECNDNNACTDDACTNNLCVHTNNNATNCDGNTCSAPDQCVNGVCIPGPNPCDDGNVCTVDLCNGSLNPGDACSYVPVDCNDNDPCTDDFCVPATGCGHANNANVCTDNNPCTIGDACSAGACLPGTEALPAPVSTCNAGGITIPTGGAATPYPSPITIGGLPSYLCKATVNVNGITHVFLDDVDILLSSPTPTTSLIILSDVTGSATSLNLTFADAAATTVPASPASGTYKPTNVGAGDPFAAPAPSPSAATTLSTFNGVNPNGAWNLWVVDDIAGDSGSITGWCLNVVSVCVVSADCSDGNPCTTDACTNSRCLYTNNTGACNDNNACTTIDTCSGGVCVGGAPPACDDGNACTANNCNPGTGLCENPASVCNDDNTCTDDGCNTGTGCVFTANDNNTCTDGDLCTVNDFCVAGVCVGADRVTCDADANVCTDEVCNPATGACESNNNTDGCNDGNACTTGDTCGPKLSENFDGEVAPNLPGTWTSGVTGQGNPWTSVSTSSDTSPNSAFGYDGPGPLEANEVLTSPPINIVTASATLTFRNRWSFESAATCFDAGVLEIDIAGGGFTDIVTAGGSFVSGGYTGTVSAGFNNPLAGRAAWCKVSAGYPAYLTTIVTLPAAAAGQTIQLRWRIGTDTSTGGAGQNIDSVVLLDGGNTCNPGTGSLDCNDNNPCTDDSCDPVLGCQHDNNADNCDDGNACTADSCSPPLGCAFVPITAPGEVQNVTAAADKITYNWTATAFATRYEVVRGNVSALPVGPGGGDEVCFGSLPGTTVADATLPPVGTAFWYLSRGANSCGDGAFGRQGINGAPGAPRVTTTCP